MFTQRTLDFLYYNHKNNSPDWYKAHKADYQQYLVEPFAELVTALTPTMKAIDEALICEPKVDRSISRIYRDMRFATDGFRYRDHCWCLFIRDKKLYDGLPGFYFEVSPYKFSYGCGYYKADAASIASFRRLIIDNSPEYVAAANCLAANPEFQLYGEMTQCAKYADYPAEAQQMLCRNNIGVSVDSVDHDLLLSDRLPAFLASQFSAIAPFYRLLLKAELTKK